MQSPLLDEGNIRIVITDAGLGGLSVVAELEKQLSINPIYKGVELIFFNAVYSKTYGYNDMKSDEERANVFNNVLHSIEVNFKPDIILIACNTLSIIYPKTSFSKQIKSKVEGIIETGITLFLENLYNEVESSIILFGTPTTINSGIHKNILINRGITEQKIFNQSCSMLESKIQDDPDSEETIKLIEKYVDEAADRIPRIEEKIFAGLCCTHYGYSLQHFTEILEKKFGSNVKVLNPNNKMVELLVENKTAKYDKISIKVTVVSKVKILQHEMDALSKLLINEAPKTVRAIVEYDMKPDLFSN